MKCPACFFLILFIFCGYNNLVAQSQDSGDHPAGNSKVRTIIVIFDGLRPDYITPDVMPHLYALRKRGVSGKDNHSVFPTVTRVNAASYATGSYPAQHGLMGNSLYIPDVDAKKALNTGNAAELQRVMQAGAAKLLTATSLGEALAAAGEKMIVYSSGTTGQAFLQNHTVNGAIINPELILPESFKAQVTDAIGPPPADATPNSARHQWITDALCRHTLVDDGPLVSAIWFSDPDGTAHEHGIGVPVAIAALRSVDEQLGRILDSINARGMDNVFNIIVTADHGFVSYTGKENLSEFLIEKGFKTGSPSDDVVVAGGAIYVKDHDPVRIQKMVAALQEREWIGAVFTEGKKGSSSKGSVKGTLSFESIHWNHPQRRADILVAENWNDDKNSDGYAGTGIAKGVAGHGGSSPYEIHIPLIAYGPSFRQSFDNDLPTSNVDIVPTILYLHHITAPASMQGRVMHEMLVDGSLKQDIPKKETFVTEASYQWGKYKLELERTLLGKYSYINYTRVTRTLKKSLK